MKTTAIIVAAILACGLPVAVFTGCETADPGVKSLMGSYSEIFEGTPDKVTAAAKRSAEQLKLTDIDATGTKLDGKVTAKTAQDDLVTIDVEQAGDKLSKVSVRVGTAGDETMSHQILTKIKSNLSWF